MIRIEHEGGMAGVRLPRMRGDDPTTAPLRINDKEFAPHARG